MYVFHWYQNSLVPSVWSTMYYEGQEAKGRGEWQAHYRSVMDLLLRAHARAYFFFSPYQVSLSFSNFESCKYWIVCTHSMIIEWQQVALKTKVPPHQGQSYTCFQPFLTQYHHSPHEVIRAATSPSSPKAHHREGQLTIWSSLVLIWWFSQATSVPKFHSLSLTLWRAPQP